MMVCCQMRISPLQLVRGEIDEDDSAVATTKAAADIRPERPAINSKSLSEGSGPDWCQTGSSRHLERQRLAREDAGSARNERPPRADTNGPAKGLGSDAGATVHGRGAPDARAPFTS